MDLLSELSGVFQILFPVLAIGGSAYGVYRRRHRSIDATGVSVLLSYYTDGAKMQTLAEGTVDGLQYSAIMTSGHESDLALYTGSALLYRVELSFGSKIHLVSVPKKSGAVQLNPTGSGVMERVQLEGDFGNYFSLFCEKGMQADARYVLDPKAMAFVVDFCQAHNWEIIGNELYFLQANGTSTDSDKTHMFDDIAHFVSEIRPAVERSLSAAELRAQTPYGKDRRTNLLCPLCRATLHNTGTYFECPNGDGVLVTGKTLPEIIKNPHHAESGKEPTQRKRPLACPACQASMSHVAYNSSSVVIDSCPNCPYRWLDAAELK